MKVLVTATAALMLALPASAKQRPVDLRNAPGYGTCWGCASPEVREAVKSYLLRTVGATLTRCAYRESGYNPSAVSRTDDHGVFQFNRPSHPWIDYVRIARDVVYNVAAARRLYAAAGLQPWGGWC